MKAARWIKLGFALVILPLAGWLLYTNLEEIFIAFTLPLSIIVLACFLALINLLISAEQVRRCLPPKLMATLSSGRWFRYFVAGRLANMVLAESGTIYRAFHLKTTHSVLVHQYMAATVFATWINILLMTVLSMLLVLLLDPSFSQPTRLIALTLAILFFLVLFTPHVIDRVFRKRSVAQRARYLVLRFSQDLLENFAQLRGDLGVILLILGLGILSFAVNVLLVFVVGGSVTVGLSLGSAALIALTMKLSTLVSITPGNIGVRELLIEMTLRIVSGDVVDGSGVLLSLVLRAIGLIVVGPLGSVFLLLEDGAKQE